MAQYVETDLKDALGAQYAHLLKPITQLQFNPIATQFFDFTAKYETLCEASFEPEVIGGYWATTEGCSWAYIVMAASIPPRIAVHESDERLQTDLARTMIDGAVDAAWTHLEEYMQPGKWTLGPQDQVVVAYYRRIASDLAKGLDDVPDELKEHPETHLALKELAPRFKTLTTDCYPKTIFYPVYCRKLLNSVEKAFVDHRFSFKMVRTFLARRTRFSS